MSHLRLSVLLCALTIGLFNPLQGQQTGAAGDKEPKLVDFADMEYPKLAKAALIQGIVVVQAKLDDKGDVVEVSALSGPETLIPASLENAKKWRFRPNPKRTVILVYNFRVTSALSKSGCSHFEAYPPNFATITTCAPEIQ